MFREMAAGVPCGTLDSPCGWYSKPGGAEFIPGLRGMGGYKEDLQSFRYLNAQARSQAATNPGVARMYLDQAVAVSMIDPSIDPGGAEVAYTREILDRDQVAVQDYAAGQNLVRRGMVNSVPDSVFDAYAAGFRQGAGEGMNNLRKGKWFFGTDLTEKLTDFSTPWPYLTGIGAILLTVAAGKKVGLL